MMYGKEITSIEDITEDITPEIEKLEHEVAKEIANDDLDLMERAYKVGRLNAALLGKAPMDASYILKGFRSPACENLQCEKSAVLGDTGPDGNLDLLASSVNYGGEGTAPLSDADQQEIDAIKARYESMFSAAAKEHEINPRDIRVDMQDMADPNQHEASLHILYGVQPEDEFGTIQLEDYLLWLDEIAFKNFEGIDDTKVRFHLRDQPADALIQDLDGLKMQVRKNVDYKVIIRALKFLQYCQSGDPLPAYVLEWIGEGASSAELIYNFKLFHKSRDKTIPVEYTVVYRQWQAGDSMEEQSGTEGLFSNPPVVVEKERLRLGCHLDELKKNIYYSGYFEFSKTDMLFVGLDGTTGPKSKRGMLLRRDWRNYMSGVPYPVWPKEALTLEDHWIRRKCRPLINRYWKTCQKKHEAFLEDFFMTFPRILREGRSFIWSDWAFQYIWRDADLEKDYDYPFVDSKDLIMKNLLFRIMPALQSFTNTLVVKPKSENFDESS